MVTIDAKKIILMMILVLGIPFVMFLLHGINGDTKRKKDIEYLTKFKVNLIGTVVSKKHLLKDRGEFDIEIIKSNVDSANVHLENGTQVLSIFGRSALLYQTYFSQIFVGDTIFISTENNFMKIKGVNGEALISNIR